MWSPILNNLSLNSAYTTGASRSEYEDGKAKNFVVGLDFNLSRALLPDLSRWSPTELHLTSVFTNGRDDRVSFLKPAAAVDDSARPVKGRNRTWRNGSSLVFRPFKAASVRWDITSIRDLRGYGTNSALGIVAASDRDWVLGYATGLERERAMQAGINISPPITAWFRPRLDFGTSYNMLRDPNTLSFTREPDSSGNLRIPRRLGNSQTTTRASLSTCRARSSSTPTATLLAIPQRAKPWHHFNEAWSGMMGSAVPAPLGYSSHRRDHHFAREWRAGPRA